MSLWFLNEFYRPAVRIAALWLSLTVILSAETIFLDTFAGSSAVPLNGTNATGATWVASANFRGDGSFSGDAGSATLAFTPENGLVYTLEASVSGMTGDANWVALGFAAGQSSASGGDHRFLDSGTPEGRAWMLVRGANDSFSNAAHLTGTTSGVAWTGSLANAGGGDFDLRIVLDTTAGSGNWTATWFAKRPADGTFTEVRSSTGLGSASISAVGLAVSSATVSGQIESFSLSSSPGDGDSGSNGSGQDLEPYTIDSETLHLWHFDEPDPGPALPETGLAGGSFSLTPSSGAILGLPSYQGFGSAGNTLADPAAGFEGPLIPVSAVTGADGAFTFEALIQTNSISALQQIVTMENASGTLSERPFQFRISEGTLQFINVSAGPQSLSADIPTSGDHAFEANAWYHVAVTYSGLANSPDNLGLYWTRMDAGSPTAHLLASATMSSDLGGNHTAFGIGQEYRNPSDNLEGSIDEVRISGVARGADQFLFTLDTDLDGLSDVWELLHFRESADESEAEVLAKFDGDDDPDSDTYDNEAEETAGTDPSDSLHTPADADRDGYEDAWERSTFGTIVYGPADDPDGDGFSTDEELHAGTDPANGFSNPNDTDGDGIPDAEEEQLFGDLSQGAFDDYDGDGIGNLDEINAGTDPTDDTDFPLVSLIAVNDGNENTDENGYAGSAINSIAFAQNNLITVGDQQIISYYRRHATDPNHADNNTVVVGRRTLGQSPWEIFATDFTSYNINDTHNVISCAIDGDGHLHMAWGVHNHPLLYARSDAPVTGTAPITMVNLGTAGMTGQENSVTYPKFQTLPEGDVVFLYREGGSGRGDWFLHRYDVEAGTWSPIHTNGSGSQEPLMLGRGDSPDNCFYPDRLTLGPDGMLHLAGVFRYNGDSLAGESGYQTNHRYVYLRSPDGGTSWERSDGSSIDLPVVEAAWFQNLGASHVPEIVKDLPEGHSIMNESGMTTDSSGRPIIANWWADEAASGDHTRQYHLFFHNGTSWQQRTVSARDLDNPATKYSEGQLSSSRMGRPVVLTDADDRIFVVYNDNRFDGITVVFSLPLAQDPDRLHWTRMNLTTENLGNWEVTYDEARWKRDGVLQMLYQKLPGMGESYRGQNNSTPVSVIEWNARAHFHSPIRWAFDFASTPGQAIISARTRTGFRYHLKTSTDLNFSDPPAASVTGDGSWYDFGTWSTDEARRFWRLERVEEARDNR